MTTIIVPSAYCCTTIELQVVELAFTWSIGVQECIPVVHQNIKPTELKRRTSFIILTISGCSSNALEIYFGYGTKIILTVKEIV